MQCVICGCLCIRRIVPVIDALFPSPFLPLFFYSFIAFLFLFVQELIKGHCPGVVTSGGSVTHKYFTEMKGWLVMRPPFPWPCSQESLPWCGNQLMAMSYC
jgi:hypothetical protein